MEENCTIFPVEGKRQVKDEETEITYIIYAVDADDKGRDDDTDLAVEQRHCSNSDNSRTQARTSTI